MGMVRELCGSHTTMPIDDMETIEDLARHLQWIADASQSDAFIDCPLADERTALVVAQAHPTTAASLYKTSVVGQFAHFHNEPAVMFCLLSGKPMLGSRGTSQEGIAMQQNVVPIRSKRGSVIGALILESDISKHVEQERNVERLLESNEQLGETLLSLAMSEGGMQSLMQEGIVLFDDRLKVTYTNAQALKLLQEIGCSGSIAGSSIDEMFGGQLSSIAMQEHTGVFRSEFQTKHVALELKAVSLQRDHGMVGGFILIRDLTELKEKEKQLLVKSAVIKEIHHRVKNNLQTVAGLLRLQMRRTKHEEIRHVYLDSINRINSIAVIHEMLAFEGVETIPFHDVAARIVKTIISSSVKPDQRITTHVGGDELILAAEQAMTLGLVLNELVQNCVNHAFVERSTGEIEVSLQRLGDDGRVRVSDTGLGLPDDGAASAARSGHIGLQISETLVSENLGGTFELSSGPFGTQVEITFPLRRMNGEQDDCYY
ncbi:sensor histidine kinase [Paenibacillus sp. BC26]|uniref:sensor histidine kinase n=1 Tax=Paenibacillus sp. BC26 TaxID=1881032 RepID=UPI0008E43A96|nr:sensor histidine kinase [Paenibacillus sp. BC26]SFT07680.1 Two-component sensor histidine kinase, contains HisKA and HATPase domains [Paenibacillus sp. BC26]